MDYKEKYLSWLKNGDEETKEELKKIENNEEEIFDRFYSDLEFGTAGLRGIMGAGSNRMNRYTVAKATLGYAKYILSRGKEAAERGVIIAYDNRHFGKLFAETTAGVLAANGIKSYLFEALRTTPELSFSVKHMGCFGGVVITASHNPPQYNGYKLYDENGCQLIPSIADTVTSYANSIDNEFSVKCLSLKEAGELIEIVGEEIDKAYYEKVLALQFDPDKSRNIKVVYTPQHGTGNIPVRYVLKTAGYDVTPVLSQCEPDPDFSGTKSPNPEMTVAYEKAMELAKEQCADIAIATDPDCDRLGAIIRCKDGNYRLMTGNQSGAVILYYVLLRHKEQGTLTENGVMFNTVVTSVIGDKIAQHFGVEVEKTLTGFKFIGDKIKEHNAKGDKKFFFGYEESYGCLIGDFVRDKDAVQASLMFCEAADYFKKQNLTLIDVLEMLFEKFGYYLDTQCSVTLKGADGAKKIKAILNDLRENPPTNVNGIKIIKAEDFLLNPPKGFVKSDVLRYDFEDGSFVAVRPSGTEPKCKVYYCICGKDLKEAEEKLLEYRKVFDIKE